jgi:hypothetical protein
VWRATKQSSEKLMAEAVVAALHTLENRDQFFRIYGLQTEASLT